MKTDQKTDHDINIYWRWLKSPHLEISDITVMCDNNSSNFEVKEKKRKEAKEKLKVIYSVDIK